MSNKPKKKNRAPAGYNHIGDEQYSDWELQYAVQVRKEMERESVQELKVANE